MSLQSCMTTQGVIAREARFGAKNYAPLPVVLARGAGAHLFDTSGKRYIDMMSAYSAASFGAIGGDHATEQLRPLDFAWYSA